MCKKAFYRRDLKNLLVYKNLLDHIIEDVNVNMF